MVEESSISLEDLKLVITRDIRGAMKEEIYTPYDFQFRASRLPFCPREYVIHNRYQGAVVRNETYDFSFYVKIGTAIHEAVQQYLGMGSFLYGHWICCGVIDKFREGSQLCLVCGRPQQYEEFEIEDSELGAHVDAVFLRYGAVGEFKSTGSANLTRLTGPYETHLMQASCYLHALNKQFGWELDKIVFVYLSRDRPSDFRVFVVRAIPNALGDVLSLYEDAKLELESGTLPDPICSNSYEGHRKGCPYVGICFHPSLEDRLSE